MASSRTTRTLFRQLDGGIFREYSNNERIGLRRYARRRVRSVRAVAYAYIPVSALKDLSPLTDATGAISTLLHCITVQLSLCDPASDGLKQ
jgi:hypothetical protein